MSFVYNGTHVRTRFLRSLPWVFCFSRSVPIILVGNKSDLHMQRWACYLCVWASVHHVSQHSRVVTLEMGRKLASDYHVPFLESSAKQNEVRGLACL